MRGKHVQHHILYNRINFITNRLQKSKDMANDDEYEVREQNYFRCGLHTQLDLAAYIT